MSAFDETLCESQTVKPLPESYSNVPSAALKEKEPTIPATHIDLLENPTEEAEVKKEFCWLRHAPEKVEAHLMEV